MSTIRIALVVMFVVLGCWQLWRGFADAEDLRLQLAMADMLIALWIAIAESYYRDAKATQGGPK